MPEKYSDAKFLQARALIARREQFIAQAAEISQQIEQLKQQRFNLRTESRRLKNANIAHDLGVSVGWVEKISDKRLQRDAK